MLSLLLVGCKERFAWHQKLIVTAETPLGEVTGASVSAVSWQEHLIRAEGMGRNHSVTGEAVVVEVAPGRYLFALLESAGTTEYMGSVAPASISGQKSRVIDPALFDEMRDKRDRAAGVITVPDYQYPMLAISDAGDLRRYRRPSKRAAAGPRRSGRELRAGGAVESGGAGSDGGAEGRVEAVLRWWNSLSVPIGGKAMRPYGDDLYGLGKWDLVRG